MNEKEKTAILIVEDDPIIANDLSILLETENYHVSGIAYDAVRAIDMLATRKVDFIILDISIGTGQTGIDVAKIINEKYALPYIFLTSFSDKKTLQFAKEQSPYGYIVKPYQEPTLLSTIEIAIHMHQGNAEQFNFDLITDKLTKTETKMCELLCKGKTYQEISESEFVSLNTIRFHVKNIYHKLDIRGRNDLVQMLLK